MTKTRRKASAGPRIRSYATGSKPPFNYRLFEEHFERYVREYEERYEAREGSLRKVVPTAVEAYLACGRLEGGFARIRCPNCQAKRSALFAEHVITELLEPVPHRHVVLTIPRALRGLFQRERPLLGLLARAARDAIVPSVRAILDRRDVTPGLVVSIQTFGSYAANFHPHVHALFTDSAILQRRESSCSSRTSTRGSWKRSPPPALGGVPWFAARLGPLGILRARRADGTDRRRPRRRAPRALPDPRASPTRRRREGRRRTLACAHPEPIPSPSRASWARLLRRIFEIDPLLCPACGSAMKIVSVITEPNVIDAILRHLVRTRGRDPFEGRAPPAA